MVRFKPQYKLLSEKTQFFIMVFLVITAFGIRLHHITKPPLDFASIRQYQNAHVARGLYFESQASIPDMRKKIAKLNMQRMGFTLEPRIIEQAAALGYRIAGGEHLWIPRILSLIFWLIGGVFLYLTAIRTLSSGGALFSTAFYLFLPYGILASRSFQPDPLMVMMLMISIFAILVYHEKPSRNRLFIAAGVSAFAMFVKPYCVFLIFGAFLSLSISRLGLKKSIFNKNFVLFSFVSLLPSLTYYGYSTLSQMDAQAHFQESFLPQLLLYSYFWKDWLNMIGHVVGYIPALFALAGFIMIRDKQLKALLSGLWIGYIVFGLIFTFHIHTHSYYHLQFIPVVALSLGPLGVRVISYLFFSRRQIIGICIILFVVFSAIGLASQRVQLSEYKDRITMLGAIIGVNPEFYKFLTDDFKKEVKIANEIGVIVDHSTNTLFLTPDYGRALAYHGELSGLPWPTSISFRDRKETGIPLPDKEELYNTHYLTVMTHGKYIKYTPDLFIITSFEEFQKQTDLKNYLYTNFPVLVQNNNFLIFDLRKMSE